MENYHNIKAMNISTLPSIQYNPQHVKNVYEGNVVNKRTQYFDVGSVTDCLLTTPNKFDEEYAISKFNISPQMDSLVRMYRELRSTDPFSKDEELILLARTKVDFDKRLLDKTVLQKFSEEGMFYSQFLEANKNKTIISQNDYDLSKQLRDDVINDPMVGVLFLDDPNIESLWQYINEWDFTTNVNFWKKSTGIDNFVIIKIRCKGLLDMVRKNVNNKTIDIIDIKTYDSNNGSFLKNYYTYSYFYQGTYYMYGMF